MRRRIGRVCWGGALVTVSRSLHLFPFFLPSPPTPPPLFPNSVRLGHAFSLRTFSRTLEADDLLDAGKSYRKMAEIKSMPLT